MAALAVSGQQVQAYAALAAQTAARRVRPVSKQENLGPRHVRRCGWGGGPSPLEVLSHRLLQQQQHQLAAEPPAT